jgi:hypothetical protein
VLAVVRDPISLLVALDVDPAHEPRTAHPALEDGGGDLAAVPAHRPWRSYI